MKSSLAALLFLALPALAQNPPPPEQPPPPHDISKVDPAPLGGAIATPLPESQARKLRKYNIEELAGSRQAIGSQVVDGRLPLPLLDYRVRSSAIDQRISFFEGGLVVVRMSGAGGTIQKRVIIPPDAMKKYLELASPQTVSKIENGHLTPPQPNRVAWLRVYKPVITNRPDGEGSTQPRTEDRGQPRTEAGGQEPFVERTFDPAGSEPKSLHDALMPLEDLLRAISEDRAVTSTLPNYEPQVGDELVADDRKTWRVERIITNGNIVELHCTSQPTIMYVSKKDLYNYFVGRSGN